MPELFDPFPPGKFDIIYADPPWPYSGPAYIEGRQLQEVYDTVPMESLKTLPVGDLAADDCLLFMWVVNPCLVKCIEVAESWGFKYRTVAFAWNKGKPLPGYYTMSRVELCLVFKRGRIPKPRGKRNVQQYVEGGRTSHSSKPEEVKRRIDEMFPYSSKIELFARVNRGDGWAYWGNEVSDV